MGKGLPRSLGRNNDEVSGAVHLSVLHSLGRIAASSVTALTDNSGGASANGTMEAIGNVTAAAVGSNDAAQLAASVAAALTATNALKELIAQAQAINAVVPALSGALVDNITGTAADHTIGAITVNGSGVGASMVGYAAVAAWFTTTKARLSQLAIHTNKIALACGTAVVIDSLGVVSPSTSVTFADVAVLSGTATGADAVANAIVLVADFNAKMVLVANAVKEIATVLNACRSATGGVMGVVATS